MSERGKEKSTSVEVPDKLNTATVVLLLLVLIPAIYTLAVNLQKPEPVPPVTPITVSNTNPVSAIETALQTATARPDYINFINLGLAYYNAGMFSESIKAWEKALEYNPKGDLAYNNIAAAYGSMKNYDAEIEICKRALAINPNLELAKRNLDWATKMKNTK